MHTEEDSCVPLHCCFLSLIYWSKDICLALLIKFLSTQLGHSPPGP